MNLSDYGLGDWEILFQGLSKGTEEVLCLGCCGREDQGVLACSFPWPRSIMAAEALLRRVLEACTNKPLILVDRGPWYPEALRSLGLKWRHMTFGMRDRIERWFGILKARTKRFSNNLPWNIHNTLPKTKT